MKAVGMLDDALLSQQTSKVSDHVLREFGDDMNGVTQDGLAGVPRCITRRITSPTGSGGYRMALQTANVCLFVNTSSPAKFDLSLFHSK